MFTAYERFRGFCTTGSIGAMSPAGGKRYGPKRSVEKSVITCVAKAVDSGDTNGRATMLMVLLKASAASSFASGPHPGGHPLPWTT
eukprot:scaffold394_cov237-Pinguiococcus_pyrenoidosus.AAC.2